jgi:hypothetical protein
MGRRAGLWLLLLVAAIGPLGAKRETVADGWLQILVPALTAAAMERVEEINAVSRERFRLAASGDDARLIAAAARYQNWIERPRSNTATFPTHRIDPAEASIGEIDALIRRAAILGADDPVVWSQLALVCEHGWSWVPQRDCPAEARGSIERLAALEPDNGWSALLALERLLPDGFGTTVSAPTLTDEAREAAIDEALARLAASRRIDGHEAAMLEVHLRILDGADWPSTLVGDPPQRELAIGTVGAWLVSLAAARGWSLVGEVSPYPSAEIARNLVALTWVMIDHRLPSGGLWRACCGELSEARLAHCRRAGEVMAQGSTTAHEVIGLRMPMRLAPDAESEAAARVTLRQQRWRQYQFLKLVDPYSPTYLPYAPSQIPGLWIETGREGDAYARLVESQGLSLTPPDRWTAPDEAHWSR